MSASGQESAPYDVASFPFQTADKYFNAQSVLWPKETVSKLIARSIWLAGREDRIRGLTRAAADQVQQRMMDDKFKGLVDFEIDFSINEANKSMNSAMAKNRFSNGTMAEYARQAVLKEIQDTNAVNTDVDAMTSQLVARQFEGLVDISS
jgi:hypothetical protein